MEISEAQRCALFTSLGHILSVFGKWEGQEEGEKNSQATTLVESLGLSQHQWKFIQYLTCSPPSLLFSPSQVKSRSPIHILYLHTPNTAHSSSVSSSFRGFPRSPLKQLPFPPQVIFSPTLRQSIPQHKLFKKQLNSSGFLNLFQEI